jgi:hypothetical protein
MENYNTSFLGAGSLTYGSYILIYNNNVFSKYSDSLMINGKFINSRKDILEKISSKPDRGNIINQTSLILQLKESDGSKAFKLIPYKERITLNSSSGNKIISDGFNTIVYLETNEATSVIGFTFFNKVQGTYSTNSNSNSYQVKKSYKIDSIDLFINISNNLTLNIDSTINPIEKLDVDRIKKSLIGKEIWQYVGSKEIKNKNFAFTTSPTYSSNLRELLGNTNVSYLITSNTFTEINNLSDVKSGYLSLSKNLQLDPLSAKEKFNHFQVGFWDDDLVMYSWTDEVDNVMKFEVFSLTKINSKFPLLYTKPIRGTASSHIHEIPPYYLDSERQSQLVEKKLIGFSGKFIYFYLPKYKKTVMFDIVKHKYLAEGVIANLGDITGKIIWSNSNQLVSYDEAVKLIPHLANIKLDVKEFFKNNFLRVVAKVGDWIIIDYPNLNAYIYSNYSKIILVEESEYENVMIINDECLLIKQDNRGYNLIAEEGNYISDTLKNHIINNNLDFQLSHLIDNFSELDPKYNINFTGVNNPLYIQKSALSYFRRNALPTTMNEFNIIAAYGGLIYYVTSHKYENSQFINYL